MPQARIPLERMLRIHQALQANRFPNASSLARELEVNTKTIHRDLEFMRDRLNLPLEYDAGRKGYFYDGEVNAFPTMQITEGEIFALVVAEKALQQYRGTSFERPLLSAIRKMERALPETISVNLADVDQKAAQALKLKEVRGAVITLIDHDAPAGRIGLRVNDVVVKLNGQPVEGAEQLRRMLREIPAGRQVSLEISRDGSIQSFTLQLADRKAM